MPEHLYAPLLAFPLMASTKPGGGKSRPTSKNPSSGAKNPRPTGQGSRSRSAVATPPRGTRRSDVRDEMREAISGREHEFAAIALIVVGVIVALAVYAHVAGPVGRGADIALGAIMGLGRYLLPLIFIGTGVAVIRGDEPPNRMKFILGWSGDVVAVLGLLHVLRGPDAYTGVDALGGAGGWLGALFGQTLVSTIGAVGAVLVFVALALGATLLITNMGLKAMAVAVRDVVSATFGGFVRTVRAAAQNVETLSDDETQDDGYDEPAYVEPDPTPEAVEQVEPKPKRRERKSDDRTVVEPPFVNTVAEGKPVQQTLDIKEPKAPSQWVLPPASLLGRTGKQAVNDAEIKARGEVLEESLRSHGVEVTVVDRTVGPTVTRYELELGAGIKVARVTSLQKDIAYALAATDVRILAPIPGKSAIGIEVPNTTRQLVSLGDILQSNEAKLATNPLDVAVGKDIAGRSVFLNLATTPHLLIAGATGAGKSSGINSIITSLLMRTDPDHVKLILIDPKQVEMGQYARLPHLLTQPVTNPKKAANALSWAVREMENRYDLLFEMGYRDITGYNAAFDRGEITAPLGSEKVYERMTYIVVVVDELNDLMMVAARDVEDSITRIAQKARAVGIHLIVATQRPSVNVITGVIKANIPARMAFAVSSQMDSRVILDQIGAEKLVGKGDMLLLPGNSSVAQRIQGCWVDEEEVRHVVQHWRKQAPEVVYVKGVEGDEPSTGSPAGQAITDSYKSDDDSDEAMVRKATELVVRSQLGSTSMLQRKLGVGFARAGRIMDMLEERGVVGPSVGSKAREVLMTVEELEAEAG